MTVLLRIENVYTCGYASSKQVELPAPAAGEDIDDWWEDRVFEETGDGHPCSSTDGSCCTATVLKADDPEINVGDTREWLD